MVIDNSRKKAFFKYEGEGYLVSEACSEKLSYEIAKVLGYDCAKIEIAMDFQNKLGILNYLFIDNKKEEHMDAVAYLNRSNIERPFYYTISNIKLH